MKELILAAMAVLVALVLWKKKQISRTGMLVSLLVTGAGIASCLLMGFSGGKTPVRALIRGENGSGSRKVQLQLQVEEEDRSLTLEVPEVRLKQEEAEETLTEFCLELDEKILGENTSLNRICFPLLLQATYGDSPVKVEWQTNAPDLLSWEGKLGTDIPAEGVEVQLKAELTLQDYHDNYQRNVTVYPSEAAADLVGRIQAETEKLNRDEEGEAYYLPEAIDEKQLHWYVVSNSSGWSLLVLSLLILAVMPLIERQKVAEERTKRSELLDREYPDLVSRMQMLLGAGLSMRKVFERIGLEYMSLQEDASPDAGAVGLFQSDQNKKKSLACEEVLISVRELENGMTEAEVYQRFGDRCGTPSYRGLALLLEQNLTKGGQGLITLLEQEAMEAFENRQRRARQEGEKVSVRLLLPMGMMLLVVLVLIIVPAFMSM